MSRKPNVSCSGDCGRLIWAGSTSLPPGLAMCRECRAAHPIGIERPSRSPRPRPDAGRIRIAPCVDCGGSALGVRCRACANIAQRKGKAPTEVLEIRRTLERRRAAREKAAPGLTPTQRRHLRATWRKQGRACAYCRDALATEIDHVIPLKLGGTNYIGNLTPACGSCNRAKGANLLIEWRAGKKAQRMRLVA